MIMYPDQKDLREHEIGTSVTIMLLVSFGPCKQWNSFLGTEQKEQHPVVNSTNAGNPKVVASLSHQSTSDI